MNNFWTKFYNTPHQLLRIIKEFGFKDAVYTKTKEEV